MTDRYTVFIKVLKMLRQMITIDPRRHMLTPAMMIVGIATGQNPQVSAISTKLAVEANRLNREIESIFHFQSVR